MVNDLRCTHTLAAGVAVGALTQGVIEQECFAGLLPFVAVATLGSSAALPILETLERMRSTPA